MNREKKFETADALEEAGSIAAVEGVDLVLIGTNDLPVDTGLPGEYEHERVRAAYARTSAACSSRWRRKCRGSCITLQPASAASSFWRARCSSCRRVWTSCTCRFASAETQKRFHSEGAEAVQMSPEEFRRFIAGETVKCARVVKEAGIRAE